MSCTKKRKKWEDIYSSIDDSAEIRALEEAGIKPLEKPPRGMGLLPTPPPANNAVVRSSSDRSVPSLLDLSVDPTQELQEKN